jgi:two-component system sensor histidine kinase HydH
MGKTEPTMPSAARNHSRRVPRWLWLALLLVFPSVVGVHVWQTMEMLRSQQELFLRGRMAALAARVESLPDAQSARDADWAAPLFEEEPSLRDAALLGPDSQEPVAAEILAGRELYHLENTSSDGEPVLRAWFPVHRNGELRVVRLDLSVSAADFLSAYATQSIALVSLIGVALMALAAYTFRLAGRAAELERRQAQREHLTRLGEMAAVLAHEIRNPLASIKGFGQLLCEEDREPQRSFAGEIVEQTGRLERLVNDLLRFGRVPEPRFAPVAWNEIATRLEMEWQREGRGDGEDLAQAAAEIPVSFSVGRANITLHTDAALLEQALANLIRNARDAVAGQASSETPGMVSVRVDAGHGEARIQVEDNGPGFSPEALSRLYEPFFTTKAFGTGLGLPTTRKLATALGGELHLASRPGGGTVATIRVPIESRKMPQ